MCDYLRAYPKAMRARILSTWRLGAVPSGAEGVGMPPVPPTEEWPVVFEGLKAFVAETLRPTRAPDTTRAAEGKAAGAATQGKLGSVAAAEAKTGAEAEGSISPSISPSISYADAQEAAEVAAAIAAVEAVRVVEAAEAAEAAEARAPAPYVTAYAAEIAVLREMGFDTEAAGSALVATSGDIDRAAERLASQPD
jgi:hypothetical protein